MSFCSRCGKENAEGNAFCGSCGSPIGAVSSIPPIPPVSQQQPPKKKSSWKKWLFGVFGVLFLLGLIGSCAGDSNKKNSPSSPAPSSKQQSAAATQAKPQEFIYTVDVGGVGKVKGSVASDVGVAIAKIQTMDTIDGSFSSQRAQGVFKVLYIVVSNEQKDAVTIDANIFKLIDEQGREFSHSVEGGTALQMSNRETFFLKKVNPGITTGGWVAFDVPKNANIKTMQFKGGMSGKKGELPFRIIKE